MFVTSSPVDVECVVGHMGVESTSEVIHKVTIAALALHIRLPSWPDTLQLWAREVRRSPRPSSTISAKEILSPGGYVFLISTQTRAVLAIAAPAQRFIGEFLFSPGYRCCSRVFSGGSHLSSEERARNPEGRELWKEGPNRAVFRPS